jgi:dynein assembly factor 2
MDPTAQAAKNLEDLKLTPDEVSKFETAFKDPEFKKMFMEYAEEISDPKNKAESDLYLRQLERENKIEATYGKGVQLVIPTPGFVVKTRCKKTDRKAFVNICHSDKCDDATSVRVDGGLQWSVPHTLGQPHEEKDKSGKTCEAYDFCVSEHTYGLTQSDERLRTMVIETAIEAVNKAYEDVDLETAFTLPKKKFFGAETGPGVQAIKSEKNKEKEKNAPGRGRIAPLAAMAGKAAAGTAPGGSSEEGKSSAFRFDKAVARKTVPAKEPDGECEPHYVIVHREGNKDMGSQFGNSGASTEVERRRDTRPTAIVVRVDVPKIDSIAAAELDVDDRKLFLRVAGKYRLDLALPYEVRGDDGKAKFDKNARRLEVTLPVKPMKMEPIGRSTEPTPEAAAAAETATAPAPATSGLVTEIDAPSSSAKEDESDETGYVMVDAAEAKAAASAAAAVQAAKEFESRGETENQRRWREMHAKRDPPKPKPAEAAAEAETKQIVTAVKEAPAAEAAAAATTTEPAAPPPAPKAATMFLRPSLAGSSLDDELD